MVMEMLVVGSGGHGGDEEVAVVMLMTMVVGTGGHADEEEVAVVMLMMMVVGTGGCGGDNAWWQWRLMMVWGW